VGSVFPGGASVTKNKGKGAGKKKLEGGGEKKKKFKAGGKKKKKKKKKHKGTVGKDGARHPKTH